MSKKVFVFVVMAARSGWPLGVFFCEKQAKESAKREAERSDYDLRVMGLLEGFRGLGGAFSEDIVLCPTSAKNMEKARKILDPLIHLFSEEDQESYGYGLEYLSNQITIPSVPASFGPEQLYWKLASCQFDEDAFFERGKLEFVLR